MQRLARQRTSGGAHVADAFEFRHGLRWVCPAALMPPGLWSRAMGYRRVR
jgi:hypothetical protein